MEPRALTTGQMAALRAVEASGDRGAAAPTIATLAQLEVGGIYMLLRRLVSRGLLERRGSTPPGPRYVLTEKGSALLLASNAFHDLAAFDKEAG
jgi:DNA-binding MarR family transcriptional regulator